MALIDRYCIAVMLPRLGAKRTLRDRKLDTARLSSAAAAAALAAPEPAPVQLPSCLRFLETCSGEVIKLK
jgi:hypothetical protein